MVKLVSYGNSYNIWSSSEHCKIILETDYQPRFHCRRYLKLVPDRLVNNPLLPRQTMVEIQPAHSVKRRFIPNFGERRLQKVS